SVERSDVLLLATDYGVLTVTRHGITLQEAVTAQLEDMAIPNVSFATRTTLALLKHVLRRYDDVAGHLERPAPELAQVPAREGGPGFLERTFKLQRQVATLKSDLWRLKGILSGIAEGRLTFHGLSTTSASAGNANAGLTTDHLKILVDEASYVYETVYN